MRTQVFNNSAASLVSILWQYDKAPNLIALLSEWKSFLDAAVKDFWDANRDFVFNLDKAGTADDPTHGAGLGFIGLILGVRWPEVTVGGATSPVSFDLYRKLLKGWAKIIHGDGSSASINEFLATVFGKGKVKMSDNGALMATDSPDSDAPHHVMTITYTDIGLSGEEKALYDQHPDLVRIYPCGVRNYIEPGTIGPLGLNETETEGQNLENYAITGNSPSGGAFGNGRILP